MHYSSKVKKNIYYFIFCSHQVRIFYFIFSFSSFPISTRCSSLPSVGPHTLHFFPLQASIPPLAVTDPRPWPTQSSTSPTHILDPLRRTKPQTHSTDPRRKSISLTLEVSALTFSSQTHDKSSSSLQLVSLSNSHSLYLTTRLPQFWIWIIMGLWYIVVECDILLRMGLWLLFFCWLVGSEVYCCSVI